MAKSETKTKPAKASGHVCWNCHQPGMQQIPNAKPGWVKCPVCGSTDCTGGA